MDPEKTFKHEPFKSKHSIRIMLLQPALTRKAKIRFTLKEASMEDVKSGAAVYHALSYVWGSISGSMPIYCGDKQLLVTKNCDTALRYMRKRHKVFSLWVDAICIDQKTVEEKNHQVAMMGEVYSLARTVQVWLGITDWRSEAFTAAYRLLWKVYGAHPPIRVEKAVEGLLRPAITDTEWFSRVWTLQEYILAPHIVFRVGTTTYHGDDPQKLTNLLDRSNVGCRILPTCFLKEWWNNHRVRKTDPVGFYKSIERDYMSSTMLLLGIFWPISLRVCQDPLDHVFNITSLVEALGFHVASPDYSRRLEDVQEEFIVSLITQFRSFSIIFDLWPPCRQRNLPLWVPSLSQPIKNHNSTYCRRHWNEASKFHYEKGKLSIYALVLGSIQVANNLIIFGIQSKLNLQQAWANVYELCTAAASQTQTSIELVYHAILDIIEQFLEMKGQSPPAYSPALASFIRSHIEHNRMKCISATSLEQPKTMIAELDESLKGPDQFLYGFGIYYGLETIITSKDFTGLAGSICQPGDVIAALEGAPSSAVLRPSKDGNYEFVCPCIVGSLEKDLWTEDYIQENRKVISLV